MLKKQNHVIAMKPLGIPRGLFHSYRGKEAGFTTAGCFFENQKRRISMNGFNGLILLFVYFAVMMAATLPLYKASTAS